MSALSPILRDAEGGRLTFWCPGCNHAHGIAHGAGPGPRWTWNGDVNKPTFSPSIAVTSGCSVAGYDGQGCWCTYYAEHPEEEQDFKCGVCHSFVVDGRIQFLNDCTHALAGQTVDLPQFPGYRA